MSSIILPNPASTARRNRAHQSPQDGPPRLQRQDAVLREHSVLADGSTPGVKPTTTAAESGCQSPGQYQSQFNRQEYNNGAGLGRSPMNGPRNGAVRNYSIEEDTRVHRRLK